MPDESVYDESAHRQLEAETAAAGEDTDAQEAAKKRAASLGVSTEDAPAGRHARSADDETAAEAAPAEVAADDES